MRRNVRWIVAILGTGASMASFPPSNEPQLFIQASGRRSGSPLILHVWTDGRIDCFDRGGSKLVDGAIVWDRRTYHDSDAPLRLLTDLLNAGVHLWPPRPVNEHGVPDGPMIRIDGLGWSIVGGMPERAEWDVIEGRSPWADRWCAALNAIEAMSRDDVEGVEVDLKDAMRR